MSSGGQSLCCAAVVPVRGVCRPERAAAFLSSTRRSGVGGLCGLCQLGLRAPSAGCFFGGGFFLPFLRVALAFYLRVPWVLPLGCVRAPRGADELDFGSWLMADDRPWLIVGEWTNGECLPLSHCSKPASERACGRVSERGQPRGKAKPRHGRGRQAIEGGRAEER